MEKIDDRDNSVVYSRPLLGIEWLEFGGPNEYMGTTSLTRTGGANAKITFSGTSIAVYGTVSSNSIDSGTTSQYSVDGNVGTLFTTNPTTRAQYGVKFFQSDLLSPGQHTLEVNNESQGGWFWLDYFMIDTKNATVSLNATSTLSTSSLPTSSTIPSTSTPTPTSTDITPTNIDISPPSTSVTSVDGWNRDHGLNPGIIVGIIFGGLFTLAFLVVLIWLIRRKLADRYADEAAAIPTDAPIPSPSSKASQSLTAGYQVHSLRPATGCDISGVPNGISGQIQHHQRQPQHDYHNHHQQHNRFGSHTSISNVNPPRPAQPAYHQTYGQHTPVPSPYIGIPQQQHGRHLSMGPPNPRYHSDTSGEVNLGYSPNQHGQGDVFVDSSDTGYGHGSQGGGGATHPHGYFPPAYPGPPPGLSSPGAP